MTLKSTDVTRAFPKPTAQVQPHFDALGPDMTVEFLLAFGGAEITVSRNPQGRSDLEKLVGHEAAKALGERWHLLQRRVPLAQKWLAKALASRGLSTAAIARRLRVADTTVRRWLKVAG